MTPTVGSLFSGIGGMDLGLERAGFQVRWQVENDAYATRVLAKHWPDVQRYGDIRTVDWRSVERVDLVAGGFPCQDISHANVAGRRGLWGSQSGLWRQFALAVRRLRPGFVLLENVATWRAWVPVVRSELYRLGYSSVPLRVSAADFGAFHLRPRVVVVGYAHRHRQSALRVDAEMAELSRAPRPHWPYGRQPPPEALGVADGLPDRVHRLRGIGNSVVPQSAEWLGHRLHALMSESA